MKNEKKFFNNFIIAYDCENIVRYVVWSIGVQLRGWLKRMVFRRYIGKHKHFWNP